jgi:hypothetical protein
MRPPAASTGLAVHQLCRHLTSNGHFEIVSVNNPLVKCLNCFVCLIRRFKIHESVVVVTRLRSCGLMRRDSLANCSSALLEQETRLAKIFYIRLVGGSTYGVKPVSSRVISC